MKIKNLQFTSPTALNFELNVTAPVCVLQGDHSALALDLIRELIGDCGSKNDPDEVDDGRFVIHSDIEMDGKNYSVCYIRNADFMGDNRIAANFVPNSLDFSRDDTVEFVDKCNGRDKDYSNVFYDFDTSLSENDDRPVFVYNFDTLNEADANTFLNTFVSGNRQVFIAVSANFPVIDLENVQYYCIDII